VPEDEKKESESTPPDQVNEPGPDQVLLPKLFRDGAPQRKPNPEGGRQLRRVRGVLPKLYPPDGKVPDSVSTETVRQNVIAEFKIVALKAAKLEGGEPKGVEVSWDTVHRALGRGQ
jgi:hypothetical protein